MAGGVLSEASNAHHRDVFLGSGVWRGSGFEVKKLEVRIVPDDEIGEFSFKITSLNFSGGPNGSVMVQVNCEGQTPGGIVALTLACMPCKSGRYTTYGTNYLDNGDIITTKGSGSFESSGLRCWRTQADVTRSDGHAIRTEGEMDLASRSWSGKVFEK
jgi:hypothetical protein